MNKVQWLKNAVFYNIYPQSFYDTNGDGIGDLNGIRQKLDFIQDMGYTAVWLNPFYESPFRDAGYDVTDYYKVAPRYGTNEDFRALCKEAHEKGIKVVVDLVAGHTALECEWFRESCKPEMNELSNRYIWTSNWDKDYKNCIGGYGQRNGRFMCNFFYSQPALNYGFANIDDPSWQLPMDHPDCLATKQALLDIMDYWISLGADGFRVDMANSLIKNDPDGTGIRAFWQSIRKIFDEKYPECVLVSEWFDPAQAIPAGFHVDFMTWGRMSDLFRGEAGRDVNKNYVRPSYFNTDGKGTLERFIPAYMEKYETVKGKGYVGLFTGNHDMPRIGHLRTQEELKLTHAFILTMPGVPFVYYGDEIGMPYNAALPSKEGGYTRTGARTPMQWSKGKNAGFSTGKAEDLYLPVQEDGVNVEDQLQDEQSLLNTTKALIRLRKGSDALSSDGTLEFITTIEQNYPLVFSRTGSDGKYLICINPTDREQTFDYDFTGAKVVMENDKAMIGPDCIRLAPVSYAILKMEK